MPDLLACIWTTKPDAYGFVGIVIGLLIGAGVSFHPVFKGKSDDVVRRMVMGMQIGKFFGLVGAFLGGVAGEVVRVLWTGNCLP
jgi:hypothetical protein